MIRRLKNRRCSRSGRCAAQRKYAEAYWSMTEDARLSKILGFDFSHLMCDAKTTLLLQIDLTGNPYVSQFGGKYQEDWSSVAEPSA